MKPTRNMLAARAEKRSAAWRRRNAALFADTLAEQLDASITEIIRKKLAHGDDYASIEMERDQANAERDDARQQLAREHGGHVRE